MIAVSAQALFAERERPSPGWALQAGVACAVLLAIAAGASLLREPIRLRANGASTSGLPHLSGVVISDGRSDLLRDQAAALRGADAGGNDTFLLAPSAGLLYLVSGLENPTRFDYPVLQQVRVGGRRN